MEKFIEKLSRCFRPEPQRPTSQKERRAVYKQWGEAFPCFKAYGTTSFYMTLDVAVVGIKFMSLWQGEAYRPHLIIYPLWRKDNKANMDGAVFLRQMYDAKNMQLDVSFKAKPKTIKEAIDITKPQIEPFLQNPVPIKGILALFKKHFTYLLVECSPVLQSNILELNLMMALYSNDPKFIEEIKEEVILRSNLWEPQHYEWAIGKLEDWRQELFSRLNHRDEILERIQRNMNEGKIAKLPRAHIAF